MSLIRLCQIILILNGFWALVARAEEVNTILHVPVAEELDRYGYFIGNKATVDSTSNTEGVLFVRLPPELVGEGLSGQVFTYRMGSSTIKLESTLGGGSCLGGWKRADCDLHWNDPIGDLEGAKSYIENEYRDRHPEAIEPPKQVAEKFHKSPYLLMRFIN